jgi:glyoxylase-like metal-dependent hydrolase (beta-lactamase superfamily II)/uncharacterized protein YndB with AHSA1/START domain
VSSASAVSRAERGTADPVKAVSVVSTGTVEIHPEQPYRSRKPLYWWILTSRRWTPPLSINAYVIEHARGLILFDTGQDRASVTGNSYFPGGLTGIIYDRLARFHIGEEDTLTAQLATLGYAPGDVGTAILSHLHQDHIGGLRELRDADLLVSSAEWDELAKPLPEPRGFLRQHILVPGLKWHQISPEPTADPTLAPFTESLDIMGDGSLVLLPTPGHTAGSMSLLVRRRARPPLLLVGDLTYGARILEGGQLPGVGERRGLRESSGKVLALKKATPGLVSCRPMIRPRPAACLRADGQAAMATFVNTVVINRPAAEVFAFLADFENLPAWNYAIRDTVKTSRGPVGVGSRYRQARSVPGRSEEDFEVTAFEPVSRLAIQGQLGPFWTRASYLLEPNGSATRLVNQMDIEASSAARRLVASLAAPRIKAAVAANLTELKRILER